jgi:hypothetical protein
MSLEPSRPETLQYEQYGATTVLALEFGRVQYLEVTCGDGHGEPLGLSRLHLQATKFWEQSHVESQRGIS